MIKKIFLVALLHFRRNIKLCFPSYNFAVLNMLILATFFKVYLFLYFPLFTPTSSSFLISNIDEKLGISSGIINLSDFLSTCSQIHISTNLNRNHHFLQV